MLSERYNRLLCRVPDIYQPSTGSRDPTNITDNGAGFVLVWKGSPRLLIGYPNDQRELMQLTSDIMLIAIPRYGMTEEYARNFHD